jgi:acetyl-CoA carboxylase carboxyltransferase component
VLGIGVISGVECVLFANDPTVLGGALTPYVAKKWMRALEIARDNRMPYVSFVESAGADLRMEARDEGEGAKRRKGAKTLHFAETGRFFYEMIELSKLRIPSVCVVFGSSTAGGAYQPGMSDYNIVIKNQSKIFLAGPPLVKMAIGEDSDDETLGGAKMHAEVSGLGEYLAEDEHDALRLCREVVSHLNWRKAGPPPAQHFDEPILDPEQLLGMVSSDLRRPLDIREVIGRVVDGSRFEEWKPRYGTTLVCGWASIQGYPIGILGNNGVLTPESAEKGAHFVQLCNQIDVPMLFLQNLTGFMVGRDFERAGIIKKGSQLINAVTNSKVPHFTVIVGNSYGAGTYAMSGRAFNNRFTFLWPSAKIAVMGGKQIAGVMSIVRRGQAARKGESTRNRREDRRDGGGDPEKGLLASKRGRDQRRRHHRPARHAHVRSAFGRLQPADRDLRIRGSACELHDAARRQPGRDRPPRDPQRPRHGDPLRGRLRRCGRGRTVRARGRRGGAPGGLLPRRQVHPRRGANGAGRSIRYGFSPRDRRRRDRGRARLGPHQNPSPDGRQAPPYASRFELGVPTLPGGEPGPRGRPGARR